VSLYKEGRTWDDIEEELEELRKWGIEPSPNIFDRGPAPNMDEQTPKACQNVIVDGEVVKVEEPTDAYDAVERAFKVV
jgi:hypothetical protein